jgi:CRISPR/Cas system-associated exonuclease Cas4 (RecB family)
MYKYDYIDRIGRFYHKANAGNAFGSTLHQALHGFHLAGGAPVEAPDALIERAESNWRSVGYSDMEEEADYRELAVSILRRYHEAESAKTEPRSVFLAEKMISHDMGDFVLTGRIDRVDEYVSSGDLEIVDYKSGRTSVTQSDVENALAMCIYQLILKRAYPDRRVLGTIHALRSGETATVELTDEQLGEWETRIREIGTTLMETDWESVRPIFLADECPQCDFLRLCERYWRKQARMGEHAE